MKPKLNKTHALLFISTFVIEVLIAKFFTNGFIRYIFGDYLVVIMLYCFFKSFLKTNPFSIAMSVLLLAFIIEFLQLANILSILNLQDNQLLKLALGSSFHISDLIAYTLGILTVLFIEYKIYKLWMA
ncbi:DUF2809 domain-containing protein [Flavobacteriaceae bacterium XHP0103]|uniref:ribosomal maturation YjgA family protein n=1 Tax=Marixanthotalea marina TaxID=2844359 RepID=UPI002989CD4F|nr:DUF2809 domain-containing protein [Marixanthotalea marina]MBU3821158.1 DUF2809 domain-containing protein [Marixanthotalea marina]